MMSNQSKIRGKAIAITTLIALGVVALIIAVKEGLKVSFGKFSDNEFLFTFLGILLGFALTVFPFIVALAEKVKENAEQRWKDKPDNKMRLEDNIKSLYCEIREDILFVFFSLVGIAVLFFCQQIDIPAFNIGKWHIQLPITKDSLFDCLRVSVFLLNVYAIYDIIKSSFVLADSTALMKRAEESS